MLRHVSLLVAENQHARFPRIEADDHWFSGPALALSTCAFEDAISMLSGCCSAFLDGKQDVKENLLFDGIIIHLLLSWKSKAHDPNTPGALVLFDIEL